MHLTLNAVIDPVDGQPDRAVVTSTLLILARGAPSDVYHVSAIVQHVVKHDGVWRIVSRSVGQLL